MVPALLTRPRRGRALLVLLAIFGSLFLASEPYLLGYRIRPPGTYFWASPTANYYDANQYLAFTRMVLDGQWLIGDPFTSEPVTPRLIMPHVYFQAGVSRLFGLDVIGSFQVCRVLFGLVLLLAGWWLGTLLIRPWRQRRLFLLLMCFSAGGAWIAAGLKLNLASVDTLQPEGNTFFTLGNLPHLSLSAALLTALFASLIAHERSRSRGWLLFTAGCSLLLSWIHPFDYAILVPALAAYGLLRWVEQRRFPQASLRHGIALVIGALPAALYLSWITRADAVYRQLASDSLERFPWSFYAIGFGPFVLPALLLLGRRDLLSRYALPICWVLCVLLLMLSPFRLGGKQPRLVGGIHIPLCILAAVGVDWLPRLARARRWKSRANPGNRFRHWAALSVGAAYFLLALTGGLWIWEHHRSLIALRSPHHYQPEEVRGLYRRLAREASPGEVSLGGTFTGGWTPVLSPARSYWGHWHMTLNEPLKQAERDWFFVTPGHDAEKAAWLRKQGIRWVIYWPWEWSDRGRWPDGPRDPAAIPGVVPVFVSGEARLYHVTYPL